MALGQRDKPSDNIVVPTHMTAALSSISLPCAGHIESCSKRPQHTNMHIHVHERTGTQIHTCKRAAHRQTHTHTHGAEALVRRESAAFAVLSVRRVYQRTPPANPTELPHACEVRSPATCCVPPAPRKFDARLRGRGQVGFHRRFQVASERVACQIAFLPRQAAAGWREFRLREAGVAAAQPALGRRQRRQVCMDTCMQACSPSYFADIAGALSRFTRFQAMFCLRVPLVCLRLVRCTQPMTKALECPSQCNVNTCTSPCSKVYGHGCAQCRSAAWTSA